jgi:uncharacterized membrane protein YoaK (UPF0700 family)
MPYSHPHTDNELNSSERSWVFFGALMLSFVAGFVNAALLEFFAVPVSHMSGAVSRISIDIGTGNMTDLRLILSIVGGFLVGAVVSGMIIGGRQLKPGRRYGVVLMIEGLMLLAATALLLGSNPLGVPFTAFACGLQNAMASSYYGLVIRTTHVTGIVTDLGVMLGQWIRFKDIKPWKLFLLMGILAGFLVGGLTGNVLYGSQGMIALLLPSLLCLSAGAAYFSWRQKKTPRSR